MSEGGHANPSSGQASLQSSSHTDAYATEEASSSSTPVQQQHRPTELERMQRTAREAETQEKKTTGSSEVQPGGTAATVKAGADYLEDELRKVGESSSSSGSSK